jgi:hypothetical protein
MKPLYRNVYSGPCSKMVCGPMREKCYVIPVNQNGEAFFAVKALTNPYNSSKPPYMAGCPSIFGGNVDAGSDPIATLVKEAKEESHNKVLISPSVINAAQAAGGSWSGVGFEMIYQTIYQTRFDENRMTFYLLQNQGFVVLPRSTVAPPTDDSDEAKAYREHTGDVLVVNLRQISSMLDATQVADAVIAAMPGRLRTRIPKSALDDFKQSGSAEAIKFAIRHIAGP